jgi:hypothetical protein
METKHNKQFAKLLKCLIFGMLCLLGSTSGAHITQISNYPDFSYYSLRCGMMGGCRLHIKGSGFDLNYDNQVMVGPYVCEVDNYFTSEELIMCEMPRMFYGVHSNLTVVMKVRGEIVECTRNDCNMNFEYGRTPLIHYMYPQALFAGDPLFIEGYLRTYQHDQIKEIRISGRNCERTEEQLESSFSSSYARFPCTVPADIENGEHTLTLISEKGTGFDNPLRDALGFTVGTDVHEYSVRVHPKINKISANSGYLNGQLLEIIGNGFGTDKSKVNVQLEDVNCNVLFLEELNEKDEEGFDIVSQKITCALESRNEKFTNLMFKGGAGLRNQVYDGRDSSLQSMIGEPTKTLRYDRTSLVLENKMEESEYTQRMYGVFTSREAGDYTFKISGDDQTKLLISENPIDFTAVFDQSSLPEAVCNIPGHTSFREFNKYDTQSCTYSLEANSDYYIMALNNEGGGADHMTVGLTMPNSDTTVPNQTPEVQTITIDNNPTRQVISITLLNAIGGTFTLIFQQRNAETGETVYFRETRNLDNDIEAEDLSNKIRSKIGTTNTVVRESLDSNKNVTTDPTKVKGFKWTISFEGYRSRDVLPVFNTKKLVGDNIKTTVNEDQPQSDPVAGHFTVKYGDSDAVKINYNHSGWSVKHQLITIPDLARGVSVYSKGSSSDGKTWYVHFDSIVGDAKNLAVVENNLTGGNNGSPGVTIDTNYKAHSPNQTYMPVPSDFLRTIETFPQITLTVDNLLAGCDKTTCQYDYLEESVTPSVTSFNLSGNTLTIQVANSTGRLLAASDDANMDSISVRFGNSDCAVSSVNWPEIVCSMPTNPDGSMQIENGSFVPMVHLAQKGYFKVDTGVVTPHDVALSIADINPKQGSVGGGTVLTISGTGFANNSPYGNSNVVMIGNDNTDERTECKIVSFNSSEIKCETPAKGSWGSKIFVTTNGQTTDSTLFSYEDSATPKITSLTPNNSSPVLKKDLVINGTGFSADPSDFTVWLKPEEVDGKEYECNTVSSTTSSITCRLSGGMKGGYRIKVHMKGKGYSMPASGDADLFHYRTTVTSITPNSGSTNGGTVLTITGTNFSTVKNENQVVIGDGTLDYCIILTATETELTCRVNAPQEIPSSEQDIYVLGRIQEKSDCLGTCKFTFDASKTPTVSSITPLSAQTGSTVTVNGTNFSADSANTIITIGGVEATNVNVVSTSKLTFDMPALSFGTHEPKILVGNDGYARYDSVIMMESNLIINSISPTEGSRYGQIFTINGNGFNTEDMRVSIHRTDCDVWSSTENQIVAKCDDVGTSNPANVKVEYRDADNADQELTCDSCVFTSVSGYPYIKEVLTTGPYDLDNVVILVDGDRLKMSDGDTPTVYNDSDVRVWLRTAEPEKYGDFAIEGTATFIASGVNCTFNQMVAGKYILEYHIEGVGFARRHSDVPEFVFEPVVSTWASGVSSFVGGKSLTIEGKGFPDLTHKDKTMITLCNQHCVITESSYNSLKCDSPSMVTEEIQNEFNLLKPEIQRDAVVTGDITHSNMNRIIDGDFHTYYTGQNNNNCRVTLDFGEFSIIKATKIRLFPRVGSHEQDLIGGTLQGSMDDVNYQVLDEVPETVVENWNTFRPDADEEWKFRYLKFTVNTGNCGIAELEVTGYKFARTVGSETYVVCDGKLNVAGADTSANLTGKLTYAKPYTPKVTGLSPQMGTTIGGTELTITGTDFETTGVEVLIDGVECVVSSSSVTQIVCVTGPRPVFTESTLEIRSSVHGRYNTDGLVFLYVDRWSDANTWGGEAPPREGDSVHVPKGQVLLVDVSPPKLYAVIVEGVIMWADEQDMTFDAWFIMVREGQLKIGSPDKPHLHNLTITLYGDRFSKMLPGFGNKSISVHNGQIDIHGKPLDTTWTELATSAVPNDTTIELVKEVPDWKVGDQIIIAPTGQSRDEVEEREIVGISGKVITLDKPLEHYHFSGTIDPNDNLLTGDETERVNTIDPPNRDGPITLRGEVGLLTRNVKIQGDPTTMDTGHGVHIMLRGQEGVARGRYSYMEVFRAGQKFQLGRYPIHFHMIGHVVDNYVIGCAVHQTFNRGTTIHGVDYLTLKHNVYYRTMGHTIFLEDGIEANNVIEHNLVVHVRKSTSMLLSDLKPSGLWQARPTNFIRDNHFVACEGNGAWFELVNHPTGPSATRSICSVSDHLVQYDRNVHHTNAIGLRIYPHYFPESKPCEDNKNMMLRDPWADNPGQPARLNDNIMYMNYNLGSFGKKLGAVQYVRQIMISDSTNQKIFRVDMAKDQMSRVEDSIYIGNSELLTFHKDEQGNPMFGNSSALMAPQTSGLIITDTRFYNFNERSLLNMCTSCRDEKKRKAGGAQITWEKVQFKNVGATMFNFSMAEYDKDIEKDLDGSLIKVMLTNGLESKAAQFADGGWMTVWFPHFDVPECVKQDDPVICSEPCAICDNSINLRKIKHTPIDDLLLLNGQDMKLFNLGKVGDDTNPNGFNTNMNLPAPPETEGRLLEEEVQAVIPDDEKFGFNKFRNCKLSIGWRGWLSVVPTSYQYNFHFGTGVEWVSMSHANDYYWGLYGPEQPVHFRHNHTEHRESFLGTFEGIDENDVYGTIELENLLKTEINGDSKFGDFMYNADDKMVTWKFDEKRIGELTNEVVYCTGSNCSVDPESSNVISETITYWSDAANWPEGKLPTADDNEIIIEETWNMHFDMDAAAYQALGIEQPNYQHIKIKGRLTFDPTKDLELRAYFIEIVHGGELIIGSADTPHDKEAKIKLLGGKGNDYIPVTSDIAPINKAIFNKGIMHMYGVTPNVTWTHLTQKVSPGDAHFYVEGANLGWNVGDEVVVASSTGDVNGHEKVTIKQIIAGANSTEIKINETFEKLHYGTANKTSTPKGDIDMRAEVGNLTRKIKISSDLVDGWGCTVLTPGFTPLEKNADPLQGNIRLEGVEFQNCGQKDTRKAAFDLNWTKKIRGTHSVNKCTFNNGQGWAVNIENSEGLSFTNNVIYNARRFGIYMGKLIKAVQINDNLIVGIKERENYDNVEYFDTLVGIYHDDEDGKWDRFEDVNDHIVMKRNSVSGSPWFGFAVPGISCYTEDTENNAEDERVIIPLENRNFVDNIAHSNRAGWIPMRVKGQNCVLFSDFDAYKNWEQGFLHRADIEHIIVENMIMADNRNQININAGNGTLYPTVTFRDSALVGKILEDCPECYLGDDCETTGMITTLYNKNQYEFYWEKTRLPMHNSTNVHFTYGGIQNVTNVDFINFTTNDECPDTRQTAIRMNNFYQDNGVRVTFRDVTLTNVNDANKLYFPNHKRHPDPSAYCNKVDCTANYNNLFVDIGGNIMGTEKDMNYFGNNKSAGRDGDCTFYEEWNGHACNDVYAQLLLTRKPDERGLNIFPLILKIEDYEDDRSDEQKFLVESNGPREVYSLIKKGVQTFVQTSQTMPSGLTYELMSGDDSDYVIIKVYSENPATMNIKIRNPRTQKRNRRKKPVTLRPGQTLDMHSYKGTCGANHYDPKNRILLFIVTGNDCEVTVEFANALQLSTHLNIEPDTFFDSDLITTFLDRMAALLEISVDRIKVVDVRKGSTIVVTEIMSENGADEDRDNKDSVIQEFESFKKVFEEAVANEEIDLGAPVLDIQTEMAIDNVEPVVVNEENTVPEDPKDPVEEEGSNTTRNILLGIFIPLGIIGLGVAAFFIVKHLKNKQGGQPSQSNKSQSHSSRGNITKDLTSNRDNEVQNFVVNNNQPKKFGASGNIKFTKQISLNQNPNLDSYIKRKN